MEATPKSVVLRRPEDGICACVNHFCSKELRGFVPSRRYNTLMQAKGLPPLGLVDVARKLHEVSQGKMTLQTMIFEPAALRLHLAIGSCPSSAQPLKALDLGPRFARATD